MNNQASHPHEDGHWDVEHIRKLLHERDAFAAELATTRESLHDASVLLNLGKTRIAALEAALRKLTEACEHGHVSLKILDESKTALTPDTAETSVKPSRLPNLGEAPNTLCCPDCGCLRTIGCDPDCASKIGVDDGK